MAEETIRGTETVLLVDDEAMIVEVACAMLERLGYRVLTAASGAEAVAAVAEHGSRIDLVILDLIMPGMDGGGAFERIRKLQPRMPVLLSSGYAIDGQAESMLACGCNGFIQKPFTIAALSAKVRAVLEGR